MARAMIPAQIGNQTTGLNERSDFAAVGAVALVVAMVSSQMCIASLSDRSVDHSSARAPAPAHQRRRPVRVAREIRLAFDWGPTGPLKDGLVTILRQARSLTGAPFIGRLVHLGCDVKAVENVHRLP